MSTSSIVAKAFSLRSLATQISTDRAVIVGLWITWLFACLPLCFVQLLPAVDFPNHLARIFILAHGLSQPGYAEFYQPHWAFLPNLSFDLICVPLAKVMPVEWAARIYLWGMYGLWTYGGARLNKAIVGRWTWFALLPALLIYNRILAYGFVNYLSGLGLLMLALALHIEGAQQNWTRKLARESCFAALLFTCHLLAFGMYVLFAVTYDLARSNRPRGKQLARDIAAVLLPAGTLVLLFALLSPTTAEAAEVHFRDWGPKLRLLHMVFQTGQAGWDLLFGGLIVLSVVALLLSKIVRIAPSMYAVIAVACGLFIISPTEVKQASNLDSRLPLVIFMMVFAALIPNPLRAAQSRNGLFLAAGCLLLIAGRAVVTAVHYAEWNQKIEGIVADLRLIPAGSILLVTRNEDSHAFDSDSWDPPLMHMDCLALMERPLLCQDLFTFPSEQPLLKRHPFDEIDTTARVGGNYARDLSAYGLQAVLDANDNGLFNRKEFVYYVRSAADAQPPPELQTVVERPRYAIFRLLPNRVSLNGYSESTRLDSSSSPAK